MTSTPDRPWEMHYAVQHVAVLFSAATLRILEARFAPGDEVPHHRHDTVVDHFWVLEGSLVIRTAEPEQEVRLGAGGYFAVLPGCVHSVRNEGDTPCRFLNLQGFGAYNYVPMEP